MKHPILTKSRFMSGLQCEKRLWLEHHRPELASPCSEATKRRLAFGHEVGARAKARYPGGVDIQSPNMVEAAAQTRAALEQGSEAIFEATFLVDDRGVKVDVLDRTEGKVRMVEVKATNSAKPEHELDAAFQASVLADSGLPVDEVAIMHLDKHCTDPGSPHLLIERDITAAVRAHEAQVRADTTHLLDVAVQDTAPNVPIGSRCYTPYECPFKAYCWQEVPPNSVFTIPQVKKTVQDALWAEGCRRADEAVGDVRLPGKAAAYVACVQSGQVGVNTEGLARALGALTYPLHYLDFETDALPIQRFAGLGPYQQFPFQFSLHIEAEDGRVEHFEYLHCDLSDPRPGLVRKLLDAVGSVGGIVVYNQTFELEVLKRLAECFPEHKADLDAIRARVVDLLPIVRENVLHPGFEGSYSIKAVLPVLVPGLGYAGRVVANGSDAQAYWDKAIRMPASAERDEIFRELLAYCEMDTRAMVEINRALERMRG